MPRKPKPKKIGRVVAAWTPDRKAVCPHCLSRPSVRGRIEQEFAGKKGWGMIQSETPIKVGRKEYRVTFTRYPCSNPHCTAEVVLYFVRGQIGKDGVAPFQDYHLVERKKQEILSRGAWTASGVFVVDGVNPFAVAAPPPVPKEPKSPKRPRRTKRASPSSSSRSTTTMRSPKKVASSPVRPKRASSPRVAPKGRGAVRSKKTKAKRRK